MLSAMFGLCSWHFNFSLIVFCINGIQSIINLFICAQCQRQYWGWRNLPFVFSGEKYLDACNCCLPLILLLYKKKKKKKLFNQNYLILNSKITPLDCMINLFGMMNLNVPQWCLLMCPTHYAAPYSLCRYHTPEQSSHISPQPLSDHKIPYPVKYGDGCELAAGEHGRLGRKSALRCSGCKYIRGGSEARGRRSVGF